MTAARTIFSAFLAPALVVFNLAAAGPAWAEELVTDLSDHLIAIQSNFTGKDILLFGAVEAESARIRALPRDIVVVVRGPNENLIVRKKQRKFGIWLNAETRRFSKVPSYYAVVSTRPLPLIADSAVLQRHQIGLENLKMPALGGEPDDAARAFRRSVIRLKSKNRLYQENIGGVTFLGETLFRAKLTIPANVLAGYYTAEVFLFRDGKVIHAQTSPLYINKSGFERYVFNYAHRQPTLYGLAAVICALFAGWLASVLLYRR